ncbi:MAG: GNAT family N-acetyltransferase [Pseudomonadota bacterium]
MTHHVAGDEVAYTITYLEMKKRPSYPHPPLPLGAPSALIAAPSPPNWYFLDLYRQVGQEYEWTDQFERSEGDLGAWLKDPKVTLYTFFRAGWPHGFFILDHRSTDICNIAYFGLVPEALGQHMGRFLLETAVHMAWDTSGTRCVTVNTNSLDHPRALPLYQKAGFTPVRRETHRRTLTRDRPLIGV